MNLSQSIEKERVLLSMWPCNGQPLLPCFLSECNSNRGLKNIKIDF
jgi:hypothetical protein